MKLHKYKQVCRLTFFGYDDELRNADYSFSKKSPLSGVNVLYDTKLMRFRLNAINGVDLSNFAKITIESVHLPNRTSLFGNNRATTDLVKLRTSSISSLYNYDTNNSGNNPTLIFTHPDIANANAQTIQNNSPEYFYNFPVNKQFLQSGQLELEFSLGIENGAGFRIIEGGLDTFAITFIIYYIEEEELLLQDTPNFNKNQLKPHASINNGKNYNLYN